MKCYNLRKPTWLVVILLFMVCISTNKACIQEEKTGLLKLKNLFESNGADSSKHLPDWVDSSNTDCCEWERVTCDPTTGHVTNLFMHNLKDIQSINEEDGMINDVWSINCSLFLPFSELRSLNLSFNSFGLWDKNNGFEKLPALKKLEIIDLSANNFEDNTIYHSLGAITSLKTLLLGNNGFIDSFPAHELVGLDNLETLDLSYCGYEDWLPKQGFEKLSVFKKLEVLNLRYNAYTIEILPYLNSVTSLKVLNLRGNEFRGSFPAHELGNLRNLESLDLGSNDLAEIQGLESLGKLKNLTSLDVSFNMFNRTLFQSLSPLTSLKNLFLAANHLGDPFPARELTVLQNLELLDLSSNNFHSLTAKDCELLSKLKKMKHIDFSFNVFEKSVLRILDAILSLRFLSLADNSMEGPISNQDLTYNFSRLEVLLLNGNYLNGSLPVEGLASLRFLEVLDLKDNSFFGTIPPLIGELSSLKVLSLASNQLNGSLPDKGLCELKKLEELDLRYNVLQGTLPSCLSNLKSLRFFNIAQNRFTGNLSSSLVSSLSSLEYIDLSFNLFEGTFSFSSLANHSKLAVFQIIGVNGKLEVETEDKNWFPMFQLRVLVLSNCNLNKLSGNKIPKFLLHQNKLRAVDLSDNNLDDNFPNWLLDNNTGLDVFNLRSNSLFGTFYLSLPHNSDTLDFSNNRLNGKIQANIGNVLLWNSYLNLSNNAFEGSIPSSFGVTRSLITLDLSRNNFSGEAPMRSFGNCTSLKTLILSNNSLDGQIFTADFNLTSVQILQLADNQFTGPLATSVFGSDLRYLDVSNNYLSGEFSGLRNSSKFTTWETVILRNNSFVGEFPCSLVPTVFMDISHNSFSGPISSCSNQNLAILKHLHLQGNNFTGPIPQIFLNSSVLLTLDISHNRFSGTIPMSLTPLSELRILLSRGNSLNGSIPSHLCWLTKISLMDLSHNFFTGSIPRCLSNITFGLIAGDAIIFVEYPINNGYSPTLYNYEGILTYQFDNHGKYITYSKREEVDFVTKSQSRSYQGNILNYMSGLDLSRNNLTGEIPTELGELTAIHALNLSHNQFIGPIPKSFSNLKQVESLDLSYNRLSGNIPIELTNLNSLAVFCVAYNNLSGTIPYGKDQFLTFNASSYEGNLGLCGLPLEKNCKNIIGTQDIPTDSSDEDDGEWLVLSAICGGAYITFLVGTLTILYVKSNWRKWLFDLIDRGLDYCYLCFVNTRKKLRR